MVWVWVGAWCGQWWLWRAVLTPCVCVPVPAAVCPVPVSVNMCLFACLSLSACLPAACLPCLPAWCLLPGVCPLSRCVSARMCGPRPPRSACGLWAVCVVPAHLAPPVCCGLCAGRFYAKGKYAAAADKYTEAICMLPTVAIYYSNRSLCFKQVSPPPHARTQAHMRTCARTRTQAHRHT